MSSSAIRVTVVHSPASHFCEDADAALEALSETYLLAVERVDIRTPAGQALVRAHRPAMSPLVLVDDTFFSSGRLPRKKLVRLLERRLAGTAPVG